MRRPMKSPVHTVVCTGILGSIMSVDLLVIGETLLDFLPGGRGPMRSVTHYDVHPGGAPANVALGAARLGCSTGLISILGEDEFGR